MMQPGKMWRALLVVSVAVALESSPRRSSTQRKKPRHLAAPGGLQDAAALGRKFATFGFAVVAATVPDPSLAQDTAEVGRCVLTQCSLPVAKCVLNPLCLANLVCINQCVGKDDETSCQIRCGDLFDNSVIAEFNACAVSQKQCVPQRQDDGSYPAPPPEAVVKKFDTTQFDGRWFISAGQNPIFDTFDCQVHYFNAPAPGKLYGKLNWRIAEPDGENYNKQAIQEFVQDPKNPGILYNHDNDYLHYEDDWYILDYDTTSKEKDQYILVYYRGRNDAWLGYGGAVLYTRSRDVSPTVKTAAAAACDKTGLFKFSDFLYPDNSCTELKDSERIALREKFASGALLTAEKELQEEATNIRQVASNTIKSDVKELSRAEKSIEKLVLAFEKTLENDVQAIEKEIEKDFNGGKKK